MGRTKKKSAAEVYFEKREEEINGLLQSMMLIELSSSIGEREGREPKRVVENAKRVQQRLKSKGTQKSLLRILAEKEQPFTTFLSVDVFMVELRHEELQSAMERWLWIAKHEAGKIG